MQETELNIPFSLRLLNHLRSFEHESHTMKADYLEDLNTIISLIPIDKSSDSHFFGQNREKILLSIHIYLAWIFNIQEFISTLKEDLKVNELNVSGFNNTNIFNVHSVYKALEQIRATKLEPSTTITDPEIVKELTITISTTEKTKYTKNSLNIAFDSVQLALNSRGKFDLSITSILCQEINNTLKTKLSIYLFKNNLQENFIPDFYDSAFKILEKSKKTKYDKSNYESHIIFFTKEREYKSLLNALNDLEDTIYYAIFCQDKESLYYLEKILIPLLGHRFQDIREKAVNYLNVLYDGVDWQLRGPFKPRIATVGNEFRLEYLIESDKDDYNIAMLLSSLSFDGNDQDPLISWHIPQIVKFLDEGQKSTQFIVVSIDLGFFPRSGFYDWKIIKYQRGGRIGSIYTANLGEADLKKSVSDFSELSSSAHESSEPEFMRTKVIHGRFIVHPKYTRELSIHEVYANCPLGIPGVGDFYSGSFKKLEGSLQDYVKAGINCVYLNGVLETDHKIDEDPKTKKKIVKKKTQNPLAVTCRKSVSTFLGGAEDFKKLMSTAKQKKLKILVDCLSRVSAARPNKRYHPHFLYNIDEDGKLLIAYGAEGFSVNYDDTAYLNYRKKETWDLIINETCEFIKTYNIDGIHIDDAQIWPHTFEADIEELERKDTDGTPAYEVEDIFFGKIIKPKTISGYWSTEARLKWANPFLTRLCRTLWQNNPDLLIIGETWGGQGYENREIYLMRSGIIPRLYKIPLAVSAIYGQHLHRDGTITTCEKVSSNSFRTWYENAHKNWPSGSIAVQSSTSHAWPYPLFLYKKGAWSYIDLLFFLPHIPITMMGELDGHGYRTKTYKHFQTQLEKSQKKTIYKSLSRENMLTSVFEAEEQNFEVGKIKVAHCIAEKTKQEEFFSSQDMLRKEIGPEYGFDLQKLYLHYEHRRQLRNKYQVLRTGKLVPLLAEHSEGFHSHVLAYARVLKRDLAIIATNFNEFNVFFSINMRSLRYIFDELEPDNLEHCVVKITDYLGNAFDEHYTVYEVLNGRIDTSLKPHSSLVWGATIIPGDQKLYEQTMIGSMERIKNKIARNQLIEGNEVAAMLTNVVKDVNSLQEFANNIGYLTKKFLKPNKLSLPQMFNSIKEFKEDPSLSAKLFAFCKLLNDKAPKKDKEEFKEESDKMDFVPQITVPRKRIPSSYISSDNTDLNDLRPSKAFSDFSVQKDLKYEGEKNEMNTIFDYVREILEYNRLGPIAFITPELGRWSTMGGLGVMVDELSQGLAELNEQVICISPYYERNRKGETNYLEKDPDDIKYITTLDVYLGDGKYAVGVHKGRVKGVDVYFVHNPFIFPRPYADGDAKFTIQQLSLMAKASLEIFCAFKVIPSLIITNDWFTALTAAYPKHGHFGDVFKGTKFLHIVHNLDPSYEGRLYPNPQEGFLEFVHNLPSYLFVDPYWKDRVMNPSRCAILASDQWATVSPSYKQELLDSSPLASILKNHPHPFAFPNGIPKEIRLKKLIDVCGNDHFKAKEILQKKYFGCEKLDDNKAVYAFVGRITQQKGVHLILESAEQLIKKFEGKVQILVGGMVNMKEPYGSYCAGLMYDLAGRYTQNFWANPNEFFTDGTLVNCGADFAMMPSMFEPGGIVQHEFFVGSTPVIAFETGGLKDSVFEFDPQLEKGNGFTFKDHKVGDYVYAVERSMAIFKTKKKYAVLRKNAFESTIDGAEVSRAWNKEFHRLFNKTFIDPKMMETHLQILDKSFEIDKYEEKFTLKKVVPEVSQDFQRLKSIRHRNHYLKTKDRRKSSVFVYKTNKLPKPKSVMLIGSFNDWNDPVVMNYDHIMGRWNVTIQLAPGEYWYKFIVDDVWLWSDDDPKINDLQGNINNYIKVL